MNGLRLDPIPADINFWPADTKPLRSTTISLKQKLPFYNYSIIHIVHRSIQMIETFQGLLVRLESDRVILPVFEVTTLSGHNTMKVSCATKQASNSQN